MLIALLGLLPCGGVAQPPALHEVLGWYWGGQTGGSVAGVGDIDGDGIGDYALGGNVSPVTVHSGRTGSVIYSFHGLPGYSGAMKTVVAGVGDMDGDGVPDIGVGVPLGTSNGSVVVYSGATGGQVWARSGTQAGEECGWAFDGAGDLDGDGFGDIVVGSPGWDGSRVNGGRVAAYSGATGAELWNITGPNPLQRIGTVVRRLGDVNGDQLIDFAYQSSGTYSSGFGVVSHRPSPPYQPYGFYGPAGYAHAAAIDVIGDVDGDGDVEFAVGSPSLGAGPGVVRIFSGLGNGSIQDTLTGTEATFGRSLAGVGDLDGDGAPDFAVGGGAAGAVQIRSGRSPGQVLSTLAGSDASHGDTLATVGRPWDGLQTLLVGIPNYTPGSLSQVGAARLYNLSLRPGSGSEFLLLSGVDGTPPNAADVETVPFDSSFTLAVESASGRYAGSPLLLLSTLFQTGNPSPGGVTGEPASHVDFLAPGTWLQLVGDPAFAGLLGGISIPLWGSITTLPAGGLTLPAPAELTMVPLAVDGLSLLVQAITVDATVPGLLVYSNAHEIRLADRNVYVDVAAGSASASGSSTDPFATIAQGIAAARARGSKSVYVASGTYTEDLLVDGPVNIRGGRDPQTWVRMPNTYSTVRVPAHGLRVRGVDTPAVFDGLEIQSAPGSSQHPASIGMDIRSCSSALVIEDCVVQSANGAAGTAGSGGNGSGTLGSSGANGTIGYPILVGLQPSNQGSGGGGANAGGAGGRGGGWTYSCVTAFGVCVWFVPEGFGNTAGQNGFGGCNNSGGAGGSFFTCSPVPQNGTAGTSGGLGNHGAQGSQRGPLFGYRDAAGTWVPGRGGSGGAGAPGCGGGGGGGGAATGCPAALLQAVVGFAGAGGGGGGGGGSGGSAGSGGYQGGLSVAVYLVDASPEFANCVLTAGAGGPGGPGGDGQPGFAGGGGGNGGPSFNTVVGTGPAAVSVFTGAGGNGGAGGIGGDGGGGVGGNGGPSIAVVRVGASNPPALTATASGNTLVAGSGGQAGLGGVRGNTSLRAASGLQGLSSATIVVP